MDNRKVKKKGSTLVEIIAAVAILLIGLTGITSVYTTSAGRWNIENNKLDTSIYNKSIDQNIKNKEKQGIRDLYKAYKAAHASEAESDPIRFYIYFNDFKELVGDKNNLTSEALNRGAVGYESGYTYTTTPSYAECMTKNPVTNKKKYGALIVITDKKEAGKECSIYKVEVKVWNLQVEGQKFESTSSFYVGG